MSSPPPSLTASWLGRIEYGTAWSWQRELFMDRLDGDRSDTLMLLEHPHTYTLGRRGTVGDLVYGEARRRGLGIALHHVDRGGRATYHGPGQLVGYPIMELGDRYDVLAYLRKLEDVLIRTAAQFDVAAHRDDEHTGVWVGTNKIGAIGVKITRGISMHGFALNVTTDLKMFEGIVPCGIQDRWVTSIERESAKQPSLRRVAEAAAAHMSEVFGRPLAWAHPETLRSDPAPRGLGQSDGGWDLVGEGVETACSTPLTALESAT